MEENQRTQYITIMRIDQELQAVGLPTYSQVRASQAKFHPGPLSPSTVLAALEHLRALAEFAYQHGFQELEDDTIPKPAEQWLGMMEADRLIRLRQNAGNAEYEKQCEEWLFKWFGDHL